MIATLMLASAHLAAPMAVDSVNFVHSYEKDQKVTYELYISSEADGIEAIGEFELAINSPLEKGKMKATFTFLKLDMDGNDMSEMMLPIDLELDKHGVPQKSDEDDGSIFAFLSLLATYLPGESLEEGGDFKIKLPDEAFGYEGSGKFEGIKEKDGVNLAILKSEGLLLIKGKELMSEITTYYDPEKKQVVFAEAYFETPDDLFTVEVKLKK